MWPFSRKQVVRVISPEHVGKPSIPVASEFGRVISELYNFPRMVVCSKCGNKRCPHAADDRNECTNSNEPGQPGSNYE